jgi:hypothetical protein
MAKFEFESQLPYLKKSIRKPPYKRFKENLSKEELLSLLRDNDACRSAIRYVRSCKSPKEAWDNCPRFDWMDWLIHYFMDSPAYPVTVMSKFYRTYYQYICMGHFSTNRKVAMAELARELRLFVTWSRVEPYLIDFSSRPEFLM